MKPETETKIINVINVFSLFVSTTMLFIVLINLHVIKCLILKISVIAISSYALLYIFNYYEYIRDKW